MQSFCTIITADYFPLAKTLLSSLQKKDPSSFLHVLILDNHSYQSDSSIRIIDPEEAKRSNRFRELEKKYAHTDPDIFRWALKPFLISWLLENGFDKVIYTDPDIYFTGSVDFLWNALDEYNVLLTPHWADLDLSGNPDSVLSVMKDGLYNAGFVAANIKGKPAIDWWAEACHFKMERSAANGLYDDQKYLDILPVQFEKVKVLEHQGCNLASWNIQSCKREMVNGQLLINGKYEPVFIHFTKNTIRHIQNRNDALLKPYLDAYAVSLLNNGFDLYKKLETYDPSGHDSIIYKTKHRLRLRTRLKRFFYRLAEKL